MGQLPQLYDESDYEALREEKDERIAELEAALAMNQDLLNVARWAANANNTRAEQAETARARVTQRNDELRSTLKAYLATIKRLEAKVADREASKAEAEAALAEQDRKWADLRRYMEAIGRMRLPLDMMDRLDAGLKARAEEAKP